MNMKYGLPIILLPLIVLELYILMYFFKDENSSSVWRMHRIDSAKVLNSVIRPADQTVGNMNFAYHIPEEELLLNKINRHLYNEKQLIFDDILNIAKWTRDTLRLENGTNPFYRDPASVLENADVIDYYGLCDTYAWLFGFAVQSKGLQSRIHWLHGHVVPEVFYKNKWMMIDPTYDYYVSKDGIVLSVEEITEMYKNNEDIIEHVHLITGIRGDDGMFTEGLDKGLKKIYTNGIDGITTLHGKDATKFSAFPLNDHVNHLYTGINYTPFRYVLVEQQKSKTTGSLLRSLFLFNTALLLFVIVVKKIPKLRYSDVLNIYLKK